MVHAPIRRPHGLRELRNRPKCLLLSHFFGAGYGFRLGIAVGATRAGPVLSVNARNLGKISS